MTAFDRLRHMGLKTALWLTQDRHRRRMLAATRNPEATQANLLRRILASNSQTEFGRRHGFAAIGDARGYGESVPVNTYEDLRPLIERQELTRERCLTFHQPVYYHRTSGTLGAPKNIPVTRSGLARIRRLQHLSAYSQSIGSDLFAGRIFGVAGLAVEGRMAGGTPFGSASGLLYQNQSRLMASRYVLPPDLSTIEDYERRYLVMAVLGLAEPAVTCIATANPSTLVRLQGVIERNADTILDAIAGGRLPDGVEGALRPDAARARALAQAAARDGELTYAGIWPGLRGIVTWTGGSCAVPLDALRHTVPRQTEFIEFGYVASEVRGTVNLGLGNDRCLPTLLDTYFEFVERSDREDGRQDVKGLHELEDGRDYYVFVTTPDGLYRYDMNDIVRVTGRIGATPALAFVQKGKGITNITGEKLSEAQVLDAARRVFEEKRLQAGFFIMLADQQDARYTLYAEAVPEDALSQPETAAALDARLRALNVEYDAKRDSGRLKPIDVRRLRAGTGEEFRRSRIAAGQRDAQFKFVHLQYSHECPFDFAAHTAGNTDDAA